MSVSVHYVDNARNVKINRGGITGYILPIPLPAKLLYTQILLYFYAILLILYYMCILLYIL